MLQFVAICQCAMLRCAISSKHEHNPAAVGTSKGKRLFLHTWLEWKLTDIKSVVHNFPIFHVRAQKVELACTLTNNNFFLSWMSSLHCSSLFCAVYYGTVLCGAAWWSQWEPSFKITRIHRLVRLLRGDSVWCHWSATYICTALTMYKIYSL